MTIVFAVLLIILILWGLGLWFRNGEDLTAWDHPPDPAGSDSFSRPDGPSDEHRQAELMIRDSGIHLSGMPRKEMLLYVRNFMEEIPGNREFDCEFMPTDADGVPAEWVFAPAADPARRVLYIHGGAFIAGSPNSHRTVTSQFSAVARAAVLAIDYRLMPENHRIEGIEDCRMAYRWIRENGPGGPGPATRLFLGGDSAGGNLSLSLLSWIRDQRLPAPDAVVALSPTVDATYSAPSIRSNLQTDTMLGPLFGRLTRIPKPILAWMYVLENRFRPVNPLVSPIFGDLSGLPPTLLQVSEAEMLLDDARRYVNKARAMGSPACLQSWAGLLHVWHIFHPEVPEAREAWERIGEFLAAAESSGA